MRNPKQKDWVHISVGDGDKQAKQKTNHAEESESLCTHQVCHDWYKLLHGHTHLQWWWGSGLKSVIVAVQAHLEISNNQKMYEIHIVVTL
jgi:hypothetical protein